MKLAALDIPDEKTALAEWLEEQIVGMDLGDLVAQRLLGYKTEDSPRLEELLGDRLTAILNSGLGKCSEAELQSLLAHPQRLLDLQEQVFIEGGEHWQQIPVSQDSQAMAKRIASSVIAEAAQPVTLAPRTSQVGRRWASYAVAASLLIGLGIWSLRPPAPAGWGFDRSGLLAQNMPASAYLDQLADAADDWFNKRPGNSKQLSSRLQTFREGCDTLLAAPHKQLSKADKEWLLERCSVWRDKIDVHLANLTTGQANFADIGLAADAMVKNMVDALHARAKLVEGSVS